MKKGLVSSTAKSGTSLKPTTGPNAPTSSSTFGGGLRGVEPKKLTVQEAIRKVDALTQTLAKSIGREQKSLSIPYDLRAQYKVISITYRFMVKFFFFLFFFIFPLTVVITAILIINYVFIKNPTIVATQAAEEGYASVSSILGTTAEGNSYATRFLRDMAVWREMVSKRKKKNFTLQKKFKKISFRSSPFALRWTRGRG
jgi:hypothetical protein